MSCWAWPSAKTLPCIRTCARRTSPTSKPGAARLLGVRGQVYQALNPQGYVQINGELWRAEIEPVDQAAGQPERLSEEAARPVLPAGSRVTVRAFRGLTLLVAPEERGP